MVKGDLVIPSMLRWRQVSTEGRFNGVPKEQTFIYRIPPEGQHLQKSHKRKFDKS